MGQHLVMEDEKVFANSLQVTEPYLSSAKLIKSF